MNGLAVFIASFGFVGYFPIAPGTAGSLAALALFAFIRWIGVPAVELSAIVLVFAVGVWAASGTERALARKDPGVVVIDEVLGMLITLALLPLSLTGVALGFLFFRALDVVKPYPAAQLEHLHGGLGIMADDAVAGLYAHLALRACVVGAGMADGLTAAIIAVGSELLTPHKTDTNSLYVSEVLNDLGITVAFKAIVGDNRAELAAHVAHALSRHRVLILTGGLGPTDDDLTREVVAAHLALPLDENAAIIDAIERRFAARGWKMPAVNRRQAMVPRGATVLDNPHGTAPGLWIEHGKRFIALLPGPPREMKPMMGGDVRLRLVEIAGSVRLHRRLVRVAGKGESAVEEIVQPIYSRWLSQSPKIETTILAGLGQVELHLVTQSDNALLASESLDGAVAELTGALGPDLVSTDGAVLEAVVGDLLRARGWWVAFAESCTGGLATSRMTDIPGSSEYVERSVVVYSNRAKVELLGVPEQLIAEHGAVSEPVALAMAAGIRKRAGVNIGIGITGIAGPGGGSDHKPVGTVCIAVDSLSAGASAKAGGETRVRTFRFPGGREMVKAMSANWAIDMLRRFLINPLMSVFATEGRFGEIAPKRVDRVTPYRSQLSQQGPHYTGLVSAPLTSVAP